MTRKPPRTGNLILAILLGISVSFSVFAFDKIRSRDLNESSGDMVTVEQVLGTSEKTKISENQSVVPCTCSTKTLIDPDDPNTGAIYHCQCGKLECAVTQNRRLSLTEQAPRPPMVCK